MMFQTDCNQRVCTVPFLSVSLLCGYMGGHAGSYSSNLMLLLHCYARFHMLSAYLVDQLQ